MLGRYAVTPIFHEQRLVEQRGAGQAPYTEGTVPISCGLSSGNSHQKSHENFGWQAGREAWLYVRFILHLPGRSQKAGVLPGA